MIQQEFKVRDKDYRVNMSSIELLSLSTCLDLEDVAKTEKTYSFILEHIESKISNSWVAIKTKGQDVYFPVGIETNMRLLQEIVITFIKEVLMPVFQKSEELSQKQP